MLKISIMYKFTYNELRAISSEELSLLKEKAKSGDSMAICKMVLCILYAQADEAKDDIQKYLTPAVAAKDEMALLLQGYTYEHAIGATKNYAKAVECYSKAYDLLNNIHSSGKEVKDGAKALQEIEKRYDKLIKNIGQVIAIKKFCQFKVGQFLFPWTAETRNSLGKLLPQLSNDVADFGELFAKAITNQKDEEQGEWEFRYQDTLLMPIEIMKALAARDYFESFLKENSLQVFPVDSYFNNALGRCLIDDEDAHDNDYIISGLLNMAGHEGDALWQYRAGLWYECCDNNLEPKEAVYWYEQAKNEMPAAKIALERVKGSLQYRLLDNLKEGTAK
jgi:TPR repeat protein